MNELDERIRAALDAQAATISTLPARRRLEPDVVHVAPRRWTPPMLAAAVVAVIVVGSAVAFGVAHDDGHRRAVTPGSSGSSVSSPAPSTPSVKPTPSETPSETPTSPAGSAPTLAPGPLVLAPGQVGVWPFADGAQANQWQAAYRSAGTDPWHLDADATAVMFAANYLGFTEMTTVTTRTGSGRDLDIGVGYVGPNNPTAAVVHLVRLGSASDSGWEVVGATSSSISITRPSSGATVGAAITVAGRITGVDENIRVSVRQQGTAPVGQFCCQAAGGDNSPWTVTVHLQASASAGVAAIVASTGGHVQAVERFAVIGVLVG
jgi:hypothetical protein